MPAGRPKIPTRITKLRGNPGKRPLNDSEPTYDSRIPVCPKHLDGEAKKEWRRITKLLGEIDLLTEVDLAVLTLYCSSWGIFIEADRQIAANKDTWVKTLESGYQTQNAWFNIRTKAFTELKVLFYELGLTPSARAKMVIGKPEPAEDEFANFLNKKG